MCFFDTGVLVYSDDQVDVSIFFVRLFKHLFLLSVFSASRQDQPSYIQLFSFAFVCFRLLDRPVCAHSNKERRDERKRGT